jgi:hypothetical protein
MVAAAAAIDNASEVVHFFVALPAATAIIDLVEKDLVGFASSRQHGRPVVAAGVSEGCVSRPGQRKFVAVVGNNVVLGFVKSQSTEGRCRGCFLPVLARSVTSLTAIDTPPS